MARVTPSPAPQNAREQLAEARWRAEHEASYSIVGEEQARADRRFLLGLVETLDDSLATARFALSAESFRTWKKRREPTLAVIDALLADLR